MKTGEISDLIRIFESVNKVKIPDTSILKEGFNTKKTLIESKQTELTAFKILSSKNVENPEELISRFKEDDKTKNEILLPVMAYFYKDGFNFGDTFRKTTELIEKGHIKPPQITQEGGVIVGDKDFNEFIEYMEHIHHLYGSKIGGESYQKEKFSDELTQDKTIFDNNGIKIYEAENRNKCVQYTQGGVTGKKYSFCIGNPVISSNQFQNYRDNYESTFYYVIDRNRDFETDPLHIVVVDHTNTGFRLTDASNHTGRIAEYGTDKEGYFEYLKSKGVDTNIFKHRPKTEEEKEEDKIIGRPNSSLEWFKRLSPDYKLKYIGRGNPLSDEQFDYLWADRNGKAFETLLLTYLNTGTLITEHQFELITQDYK